MPKLKHPKAKGTRLENEVVEKFKAAGYNTTKRMWSSNGESMGLHREVDILVPEMKTTIFKSNKQEEVRTEKTGIGDLKLQCKFVAALAAKYKPSEYVDATVFRENHGEHYIIMRLDDFLNRFM